MVDLVMRICRTEFEFSVFVDVMDYFKKMINICKQMNYSKFKSDEFSGFEKELEELVKEKAVC
jgi:V/A-type H+-transporting ATPase subunit A